MNEVRDGVGRRQVLYGLAAAATVTATPIMAAPAGKSVLITGTSSGFGKLTALDLARGGANVIASMRNLRGGQRPEAQELRDIASTEKLKLTVVEIDVLDEAMVNAGVKQAETIAGGALDVLVNNAGIGVGGPVEMSDEKATQLIFSTNVFGYLRTARAALPAMRARSQGLIFNVSSQLGRIIVPNISLYSATKFAVEAMSEQLAYELAPFGIEVTIIEPGGYPTKIWESGQRTTNALLERTDGERKKAYARHISAAERLFAGGGSTDPADVSRAIAGVVAMPAGSRPLRRPVHPNTKATDAANSAMTQIQGAVLGSGPYADWYKAVTS